jgi:hypothetical protein
MRIWNFLFRSNRLCKKEELVYNLHVCIRDIGKMDLHTHIHYSTRILASTKRKNLIFFRIIYVAMSNNQFSALDNVKMTCKHISTKITFKITPRKRYVYIDIGCTWISNQCFYLGIWNNDRTKMIVLPSFQLAKRLNSQNTNGTEFINELWHINLFMNIGISNWHYWSFDLS